MQGLKHFLVRAEVRDLEIRGITVLYDQAIEGTTDYVALGGAERVRAVSRHRRDGADRTAGAQPDRIRHRHRRHRRPAMS